MDVVGYAANDLGAEIQIPKGSTNVGMQTPPPLRSDEGPLVFGAKHEMTMKGVVGGGHGAIFEGFKSQGFKSQGFKS